MTTAADAVLARIREHGPITVAEFMEIALYHPEHGYYCAAARRSGRAGDFFTNVDVGPLFGEMLAVQIAEMANVLGSGAGPQIDMVEAGAGDGRLAKDVLDTLEREAPATYARIRMTLVERSASARAAHAATLGTHAARVASTERLPGAITGVIFAHELLDALPVHVVEMTARGPREVHVAEREGRLVEVLGRLSDDAIAEWLARGARLDPGQRAEVRLAADAWVRSAGTALRRGFLLLFDYGHPAAELYSATHARGTLMAYRTHTADAVHYLTTPGEVDLTAHVDLSAVERTAGEAGLKRIGIVDQTYFLAGLGLIERLDPDGDRSALSRRLAARTLLMPGGLGSTIKALAFSKDLPEVSLRGFASGRLT